MQSFCLLTSFLPLTAQCVTWGVAYKIAKDKVDQVLAYLDYREKVHSFVPLCVAGWPFSEHSFLPILSTPRVAIPGSLSIFIHTKAVSSLLLMGLAWPFFSTLYSSLLLLFLLSRIISHSSKSCLIKTLHSTGVVVQSNRRQPRVFRPCSFVWDSCTNPQIRWYTNCLVYIVC